MPKVLILFIMLLVSCFSSDRIVFTPKEQHYIETTIVTWLAEKDFYPFILIEADGITGISKDYLDLISKKTGLRFNVIGTCQFRDCLDTMKRSEVNLLPAIKANKESAEYILFSRPYIFINSSVVSNLHENEIKSIGLGRGHSIDQYITEQKKNLKIYRFENDEESFIALMEEKIDSVGLNNNALSYLERKYNTKLNKIDIPFDCYLSMGIAKNQTELRSIFDKAISNITTEEHRIIRDKWK